MDALRGKLASLGPVGLLAAELLSPHASLAQQGAKTRELSELLQAQPEHAEILYRGVLQASVGPEFCARLVSVCSSAGDTFTRHSAAKVVLRLTHNGGWHRAIPAEDPAVSS
eukprot:RCo002637